MSKRKRDKKKKLAAPTNVVQNPPQTRPIIHSERRPTPFGDYEIRLQLESTSEARQELVGRFISPDGKTEEAARVSLPHAIESDASRMFGVPPGLDPVVFREVLESCRKSVEDAVRQQKQSNR